MIATTENALLSHLCVRILEEFDSQPMAWNYYLQITEKDTGNPVVTIKLDYRQACALWGKGVKSTEPIYK